MMAEGYEIFSHSKGSSSKSFRTGSSRRQLKSRTLPMYVKKKFEKKILNLMEVIETDMLLGKPIRWNMLFRLVNALRINSEAATPGCLKFVRALFNLFERYQCRDVFVMSEVFRILFSLTTDNYRYTDAYDTEIRNYFCKPYGAKTDDPTLDFVWNAVRSGNLCLLKLQLKFGMLMMTPFEPEEICYQFIKALLPLISRSTGIDRIEETVIKDKLFFNFSPKTLERLFLILRMLEIVVIMQLYPQYEEHVIECYKLLFDSIPEAYITSFEVKCSLEKCLPNTRSTLISKIAEDFKRLLPELSGVPQPRSLKHLCRFQVRESLRQNQNLPHCVSSLPLPAILKKYIMLHDDGDFSIVIRSKLVNNWETKDIFLSRPISVLSIPEADDCLTSFLKNSLTNYC